MKEKGLPLTPKVVRFLTGRRNSFKKKASINFRGIRIGIPRHEDRSLFSVTTCRGKTARIPAGMPGDGPAPATARGYLRSPTEQNGANSVEDPGDEGKEREEKGRFC